MIVAAGLTAGCSTRASIQGGAEGAEATADSSTRVESARARHDSTVRMRPGYVVDSILPVDVEIRRFQATLGEQPAGLTGGAVSREALVRAFVRAIEQNDTSALAGLVVDRREFGFLVYPDSPNAMPPYRQSPSIVWLTRSAGTEKSAGRLLQRFAGRSMAYAGFTCPTDAAVQGANTIWSNCVVNRLGAAGDTTRVRLFGAIMERGGRYKFLSLAGGL